MRTKKSKYLGREVTLCRLNRQTGESEKVSGIFRGYLGKKNVLIDTGHGLYEQYVIGTAPGRWMIFPASVQIIFQAPAPPQKSSPGQQSKKRFKEDSNTLSENWSVDSDDLLAPDWSAELDGLCGNNPYQFSLEVDADL
jgi:hypothetical protein